MTTSVTGTTTTNPYTILQRSSDTSGSASTASAFTLDAAQSASGSAFSTADLVSHSLAGYAPAVQLSADQLAALQADPIHAPDPAKTAAQNNDKAYAVITDTQTGKLVGGVWPNAAIVSGPNIAPDDRLTGNTNMSEVTQALAQDIEKATGHQVSIQYFQPNDPNAPTFGSTMGMA